jgi:hypothetical protein
MDKFGPEVKKKLNSIDTKKEGSQVAGRFGVGFNGAFGGIARNSAALFIGAFAAIKGAQVFGSFIADAQESAKISRITANAIRTTGGAANITAGQVGDLATAISNKTAIDDEQVQTAANMLLTFKNIRNETGKNNDIFNRATQAAADLSVQFGGIDGASKQLGKALNDPVKGISALSKAGVTFTAQQKTQIKTLTESGDVLGAQKIILKEIEGQVGGAAAAAADPIARLKVVSGNLAEEVGGFLLPAVSKFASFTSDRLIPGISELFNLFKTGDFTTGFREAFNVEEDSKFVGFLLTIRETAISVFTEVTGGIQAFAAAWKYNDGEVTSSGFPGFMERLGFAARQAFGFFKTEVLPRLKEFGGFVVGTVIPAVANLIIAFRPLAEDVGVKAVEVFRLLLPVVQEIAAFIGVQVVPVLADFTKWLKENSTVVGAVAVGVAAMVVAFKAYHLTLAIVAAATKAYAAVQAALNVVMALNPIGVVVLALVGLAAGLIYAYKKSETFRNIVNAVFGAVRDEAVEVFDAVVGAVRTAIDWVQANWPLLLAILTGPFGLAVLVIARNWDSIKSAAQTALRFVVMKVLDFAGSVVSGAAKAFGWVPGLGPKLKTAATEFAKFRDSVNGKLGGINDQTITIKPVFDKNTMSLASAGRRASGGPGGPVDGPGTTTSDTAGLYALSRKEWVIKAKSSMKYGDYAMRSVNEGTATIIPDGGFARGGRPGLSVRPQIPSDRTQGLFANNVATGAKNIGQSFAGALAKLLGVSPGLGKVLSFVKSQVGKPYSWGGVGPGGYDCSGLVSAAINTALGRNPHSRIGATGSMPWSMFRSGPGAFEVGWFKGNPGHTAATVNGVNIESRGGRGVVMGRAARGARDGLFTNRASVRGFAAGGKVGDAAFDVLDPRGKSFAGKQFLRELGIDNFDTGRGKRWESGTLGVNMSGKTERVFAESDEMTVRLSEEDRRLLRDAGARPITLNGARLDESLSREALRRY